MAGGRAAFFSDKEGVEDQYEERAGHRPPPSYSERCADRRVGQRDDTVRARRLIQARQSGVKIIVITWWPGTELHTFVDVVIAPMVGPEVIAGSTRLKTGTATNLVLNMLTRISIVHIGKTYGNLMVDIKTGSEKARDRSGRIITVGTGLDHEEAGKLLRRARWNVKVGIVMQKTGDTYSGALPRLKKADQSVRTSVGEDVEPTLRESLRRP